MILQQLINEMEQAFDEAMQAVSPSLLARDVGMVTEITQGIARVRGLPHVRAEELVRFPGDVLGIAFNLEEDEVGVILLGDDAALSAGDEVTATGRLADTPVGEALMGRVIDPTGKPLDDGGPIETDERRGVEQDAPAIMNRAPVTVPLQTGLKAVDALIPIGRGQRELIVGDRQTGKTTVALDAILNQHGEDVICIYCAIGQRGTAVARVIDDLKSHGALAHSIVMVASGEDAPGLQYICPYAAMSVGEYFMQQGRDVLLVLDDLTRHARAYRELSLLLRRPPGREAYPGDIFYIHSRLLERATHLRDEAGGGSLTALPIIETQAQDISAYIPTNLVSITDGQIYLSPKLFRKGVMPAIDVGKSVSRVGGKTQLPAYRAVAGDLRLAYSQFEELETFSRFATRLDEDTRKTIERGRRVRQILKQSRHDTLSVPAQIVVLHAVNEGLLDTIDENRVPDAERRIREQVCAALPELMQRISAGDELGDGDWQAITDAAREALEPDSGQD
jgi:F-type H+-transporting ATPase subunit alpha